VPVTTYFINSRLGTPLESTEWIESTPATTWENFFNRKGKAQNRFFFYFFLPSKLHSLKPFLFHLSRRKFLGLLLPVVFASLQLWDQGPTIDLWKVQRKKLFSEHRSIEASLHLQVYRKFGLFATSENSFKSLE